MKHGRVKYRIGDVIYFRTLNNALRRVIVTNLARFEGWDGFNGYYEDTRELVWGFDLQIEGVVKTWRKEKAL